MGDPRKQHKLFKRPRVPFDRDRIEEERDLTLKYGLKNKREIWRAETFINRIRAQAKKLIVKPEEQPAFFSRLINLGLIKKDANIDDVLALTREKLLDRRLQTVVLRKGLAKTIKEARQLTTHRKVLIGDRIVDIPSYIVKISEENQIKRKPEKIKEKPQIPVPKTTEQKPAEEKKEEKDD